MQLDPRKMPLPYEAAFGALLIISGVIYKNSMQQMNKPDKNIGMVLFVAGWILFANAVARNDINLAFPSGSLQRLLPYASAALVVGAVMMMKKAKNDNGDKKKMKMYMAGFVIGWLLFAYSIGQNRPMAFGSALLVFASMMYFLPKQRANAIVDGPGLPLFVIAWVGLIIANSNLAPLLTF